jgi:curved DNA-binding protein CbpA
MEDNFDIRMNRATYFRLVLLIVAIFSVSDSLVIPSQWWNAQNWSFHPAFSQKSRETLHTFHLSHSKVGFRLSTLQQSSTDESEGSTNKNSENANDNKNNTERTLYAVLQVETTATREEIKKSYFRLAKMSHPDALIDRQQNGDESTIDFQEIAEAWKILGNSKLRKRYDRELKAKEWSLKAQAYTNERLEQAVPVVAEMMDTIAVPFLRKTTATTWAVGQAIATGVSGFSRKKNGNQDKSGKAGTVVNGHQSQISGPETISVENAPTNSTVSNNNNNAETVSHETINGSTTARTTNHQPIGLTETFLQALEAGQQAAREIDSLELNEKADQLQERYVLERCTC